MSKTIQELRGKLNERRDTLHKVFEEAGETRDMSKVKTLDGDNDAKIAAIRALNDEMTDLSKQIEEHETLDGIKGRVDDLGELKPHPGHAKGGGPGGQEPPKSIGELFVENDSYKGFSHGQSNQSATVEAPYLALKYSPEGTSGLKATFTVGGATLTAYDRQPGIVLIGQQRLTVADLLAKGQTSAPTIRYVKEDTYTNAATTVAEGGAKPEASWDTSEVDAPVRKIAVLSRVTDELFADFPAIRDYIDNRMRFMLGQTEEAQLLNGDGIGSNLTGILQTSGIQTQAKGADPAPDAVYKAIVKVRAVGFFEPDGYVTHPTDWQGIRLLRDANGQYIWGHPSTPGPEMIWGLPTVVTTAITQGTGLVGAFQLGAQVFYRQGVTVDSTNSNEDDFKKNLVMLRAEQREALAVYRPKAFSSVTGL